MKSKLTIPTTLINPISNNENKFLLLNNEFNNDTTITGFELYGETAGSINIQIVSSDNCGKELNNNDLVIPCAVYFNNFPPSTTLNLISTFSYTISVGYNKFLLSQPMNIQRGYFILLQQVDGKLAVDTSGNATYSDMVLSIDGTSVSKMNTILNHRFYFNALNRFDNYYFANFNVAHSYLNVGYYLMKISIRNYTFEKDFQITDSKYYYHIFINYYIV